ncbi:hypothetical protein ACH5A3_21575 [Streptomyces echinatus]|uniref:phage fiber-tail adaptor protein n=1 Tax=Streptomyces echinatus TaxID=67293 RepID=UPI0037AFE2E7
MTNSFIKDPSALLDYSWDWSAWLAEVADIIVSATITVPSGLTAVGPPAIGDTIVTQRVSGGSVDVVYAVTCRITTAGGLIDERSLYLTITER